MFCCLLGYYHYNTCLAKKCLFNLNVDKGLIQAFDEKTGAFSIKKISKATGYEHSENNLNAIEEDEKGRLWIGTIYCHQQGGIWRG